MGYRKEIAFLAIGAAFGTAMSIGFRYWQQKAPNGIVVLASIALLLLFTLSLISLLGPLRQTLQRSRWAKLGGRWEGSFWYQKNGERVEISEDLVLTQRGLYVIGRSTSTEVRGPFPFRSAGYKFDAALHPEGILTGTWSNLNEGRRYFGTLLATVSIKGNIIEGEWLGTEATGLREGGFKWTRV